MLVLEEKMQMLKRTLKTRLMDVPTSFEQQRKIIRYLQVSERVNARQTESTGLADSRTRVRSRMGLSHRASSLSRTAALGRANEILPTR